MCKLLRGCQSLPHVCVVFSSNSQTPYTKNWTFFKSFFALKPSCCLVLCDPTNLIPNVSLICTCQAFISQGQIFLHHCEESSECQGLGEDAC